MKANQSDQIIKKASNVFIRLFCKHEYIKLRRSLFGPGSVMICIKCGKRVNC